MDNLITLGGVLLVISIIYLLSYVLYIVILLGIKVGQLLDKFLVRLERKLFGDRRR